jgi:hypothetical protein
VPLVFSLNRQVNWVGYSLDGETNETIAGNVTIANLTNGAHSIVMYSNDSFGNVVVSQNVTFMVAVSSPKSSEQLITIAAISTVAVVIIAVALLVYFKKRKR